MNLSQDQIHRMISLGFLISPVIMLAFLARFIYIDRELYFTASEILRVTTIMPFLGAIPYWCWSLYLKTKYLDMNQV